MSDDWPSPDEAATEATPAPSTQSVPDANVTSEQAPSAEKEQKRPSSKPKSDNASESTKVANGNSRRPKFDTPKGKNQNVRRGRQDDRVDGNGKAKFQKEKEKDKEQDKDKEGSVDGKPVTRPAPYVNENRVKTGGTPRVRLTFFY